MAKPEAISSASTSRTAQPDARSDDGRATERTRAGTGAGAGADNTGAGVRFPQCMRRPTAAMATGENAIPSRSAGESRLGPLEGRDREARDDERGQRGSELQSECDRTPISIGAGPGAPFVFAHAPVSSASATTMAAPIDQLFAQLVTRAAVGGDAKRGSMRLELGGRVAGRGHLTVHAEGDDVEIEIAAPPGVDATALETRVTERLAAKGVKVTRFDVR